MKIICTDSFDRETESDKLNCPNCDNKQHNELCLCSNPPQYEYRCICGFYLLPSQRKNSYKHITQDELSIMYEKMLKGVL